MCCWHCGSILDSNTRDDRGLSPFLNFMQFFGKFGNFVRWRPPGRLAAPPKENPGSVPGNDKCFVTELSEFSENI